METKTVSCPFHQEKTPSCIINVQTQEFKCISCGARGFVSEDGKLELFGSEKPIDNTKYDRQNV